MVSTAAIRVKTLAWVTIWATLALLALGNVVTTTGSGMGCGDHWPDCNGQWIPDLSNPSVLIEFSHRVLAGLIGLLTLITAVIAWQVKAAPHRKRLTITSVVALLLLILQIVLGALTVRYELPPRVVFLHLGVSMAFFAALVVLAHLARDAASERAKSVGACAIAVARFHTLSRWTAAVLYLQILLGAHVRHSGAGLACGAQWLDALLCQGQWIPPLQELPMVQFTHRLLALIVAGLIMSVAAQARRAQLPYALVRQARGAAALVVLQIAFGVMSVTSLLSAHWTTLHLVTAALMLALLVGLVAQSRPSVLIEGSAAQSREVAAS